jgi:hypothetical protein
MQPDAAHCNAAIARKVRRHGPALADKTNSAKRERLAGIERDTQPAERIERIRHQAFAASLVDGRLRGVGDNYVETFEPRGDGSGQARRPAADDE